MKGESFLLTLAQIGLALAGFAGLISVFRKSGRDWIPQEVAGMKLIFEHTFAEVFFALLPFPLFYIFESEPRAWKLSSLLLACFFAFDFSINAIRLRKLTAKGAPPRRRKAFLYIFMPVTVLSAILQVLNLFVWGSVSNYIWGLLWLLVAPSVQFFHFILSFEQPAESEHGKPEA